MNNDITKKYELAKEIYAEHGIDIDKAIEKANSIPVSMHCWQGDDVRGFLFNNSLSGGIQTCCYFFKHVCRHSFKELWIDES